MLAQQGVHGARHVERDFAAVAGVVAPAPAAPADPVPPKAAPPPEPAAAPPVGFEPSPHAATQPATRSANTSNADKTRFTPRGRAQRALATPIFDHRNYSHIRRPTGRTDDARVDSAWRLPCEVRAAACADPGRILRGMSRLERALRGALRRWHGQRRRNLRRRQRAARTMVAAQLCSDRKHELRRRLHGRLPKNATTPIRDEDDACPIDCRGARCGDGHVWVSRRTATTAIDASGDGCSDSCELETDRCAATACCDGGEECDDGNRAGGDGCSAACKQEPRARALRQLAPRSRRSLRRRQRQQRRCLLEGLQRGGLRRRLRPARRGTVRRRQQRQRRRLHSNLSRLHGTRTARTSSHRQRPLLHASRRAQHVQRSDAVLRRRRRSRLDHDQCHRSSATSTAAWSRSTAPTWIGLRTTPTPPGWITGEPTSFQAWAAGEPSAPELGLRGAGRRPAIRRRSGVPRLARERYPFVCESEAALVFAATHHAYVLHTRARPWVEARDACADAGGYLVSIETDEEQAFLAQHFSIEVWLGATRGRRTAFEWTLGAPRSTSRRSRRNQPDNAGGTENCLVFNRFDAWADVDCTLGRRFVCEFE